MSWNLHQRNPADSQAEFLCSLVPSPDLLLLQEVNPNSIGVLADKAGMAWYDLSIDHYEKPKTDARKKVCGVAIAGRNGSRRDVQICSDIDFPDKIIMATINMRRRQFVVASYHAPPGVTWPVEKQAQAVTFARKLANIKSPVLFGADLNTPKVDAASFADVQMWLPGEQDLAGPRKIHHLEDALRQWLRSNLIEQEQLSRDCPGGPLRVSYEARRGNFAAQRRYDAIWVSDDFQVASVCYPFKEIKGLSDHSPVIADLIMS